MITSSICAIVTLFMSVLHLLLLFGAPLGEYVLGGKNKVVPLPKRWINLLFSLLFSFLCLVYSGNTSSINLTLSVLPTKIVMWSYTAFLAYAMLSLQQVKRKKL